MPSLSPLSSLVHTVFITGENFVAIDRNKITFKAIEKHRHGLRETVSKDLKQVRNLSNKGNSLSHKKWSLAIDYFH